MDNMWMGERVTGEAYQLQCKSEDSKQAVRIYEVIGRTRTGRTAWAVTTRPVPIKTRGLPTQRDEADTMVNVFLYDLCPEKKKLVIERLCAE